MTLIIGLTGGIASGKSTVSTMLHDLNIPIIDADKIAREVVMPGKPAYKKIVEAFSCSILMEDQTIDRKKLGDIIFSDEQKRRMLNEIVHPAVREEMNLQKDGHIKNGEEAIVLDIPLLFESKLTHLVHKILLVYVDKKIQLERLMKRNSFTEKEAKARISSQMPLYEKVALADETINNNGALQETRLQLLHILKKWGIEK